MTPNTRSGSHVGGLLLSQHVGLCSLDFRRVASGWLRDRVRVLQIIGIHSHMTSVVKLSLHFLQTGRADSRAWMCVSGVKVVEKPF